MKCSCEADRSFNSEARHLAMNSYGVMGAFSVADDDRRQATASQIRTPARDVPTYRLPIRQSVADSGGGPGGAVLLRTRVRGTARFVSAGARAVPRCAKWACVSVGQGTAWFVANGSEAGAVFGHRVQRLFSSLPCSRS